MPRRNSRRNQRKSRRSKKGRVDYKKLMDKKINTALERRMVQISQAQQKTLCNRKWCAGLAQVNGTLNQPPVLGPDSENKSYHTYHSITSTPYLSDAIMLIRASDYNSVTNVNDPTNPDNAGAQRIMITDRAHGFRKGNTVKVKGIALDVRVKSDYGLDELHNTDNNTALNLIQEFQRKTQGRLKLDLYVVQVQTSQNNQNLPDPKDVAKLVCKYDDWGKSNLIDIDADSDERAFKRKVLMKKTVYCSPSISYSKHGRDNVPAQQQPSQDQDPTVSIIPYFSEFKMYRKFNNPIEVEYQDDDQSGREFAKNAIYFVAKSNFKDDQTTPLHNAAAPKLAVISKVYYVE